MKECSAFAVCVPSKIYVKLSFVNNDCLILIKLQDEKWSVGHVLVFIMKLILLPFIWCTSTVKVCIDVT